MKILIINPMLRTPEAGKIPIRNSIKDCMIYKFSCAFKKMGHIVTLVAAEEYKPSQHEDYPIQILFLKSYLKKIFKPTISSLHLGIWELIRRGEYDLIITSEAISMNSLMSCILESRKTVVWQEISKHNKMLLKSVSFSWYNCIVRLFMSKTLIIARSRRAKYFISKYSRNVANVIVGHGVDLDKFAPCLEKPEYFVVLGQLIKRKNVASIIRKFADYRKKSQVSTELLIIVGDGPEGDNLKSLVKDVGMESFVVFKGYQPHDKLVNILRYAKGALVDTGSDLSIFAILECIACGVPVITNTVPDNSEFVEEFNLGIVKQDWGYEDLELLSRNWQTYSKNANEVRHTLSYDLLAKIFLKEFQDNENFTSK